MDWNSIWQSIVNFFTTSGWNILYAILVLVLGYVAIKIIYKIVKRILSKSKLERITQGFILSILKVILYVVLILAFLQMLGVPITGLTAVLATAGAAIALSLKDSLSNIASGMIMISNKPFDQGDYIQVGNLEGTVSSIHIMTTEIITTDNKKVVFPNSNILNSNIINYSGQGSRRQEIYFDIAYETDIDLAKKIILDVCHSNGKILLDPAPEVNLKYFKESNLQLFLTCWSKAPYWEIYFYIMDNVYNEFKRNNINIAYNQVEVRMRTDEPVAPYRKKGLPKRVEPKVAEIEEFNIFNIDSFETLQKKTKMRKIKALEKKRKQLDAQLKELTADLPASRIQRLIEQKSIMLKNKKGVQKSTKNINYYSKLTQIKKDN